MRKIINGRRYDTETAECLAHMSNDSNYNDFRYLEESLYRKKTGEYFLCGSGGPMSKYCVMTGLHSWSGSTQIKPLTIDEARQWTEQYANSKYESIFGDCEE